MAFFLTALLVVPALLEPATAFSSHGGGGGGAHWGYYQRGVMGPWQWSSQYHTCGMYQQSPIDIHYSIQYTDQLEKFNLQSYNNNNWFQLHNVGGHTAEMKYSGNRPIYINGGSLGAYYQLKQFHFHWGNDSWRGSEHQIGGRPAPLEMHLVHQSGDRLAVLSFLFVIGNYNYAMQQILNRFNAIHYKDRSSQHFQFNLGNLLPSNAGDRGYYRYCGSLTTPPCTEHVIWSVFEDRIQISEQQMKVFRYIHSGFTEQDPVLVNNFRPVQNLNDRKVYHKAPVSNHMSFRNSGMQAEFQCNSNTGGHGGNTGGHGGNTGGHGGGHGGPTTSGHGGGGHGGGGHGGGGHGGGHAATTAASGGD